MSVKEWNQEAKEQAVIQQVRKGLISRAKGAELLGMDRWAFLELLSKYDIPYFDLSEEDLRNELEVLKKITRDSKSRAPREEVPSELEDG